jgi:hypothetical protein
MSISTVTSEALQLKLRQLLPSQQGFGTDLSASDTIIPVIDLTASAEGSDVRQDLQTALAFGSQTVFSVANSSTLLETGNGFFRITGSMFSEAINGTQAFGTFELSDGSTTKRVFGYTSLAVPNSPIVTDSYDFVVFLDVGITLTVVSTESQMGLIGSSRQIATSNGTLVQPVGFTPQ